MSKSAEIRRLITKNEMSFQEVVLLPTAMLTLWRKACVSVIGEMECDRLIITTVEVKAVVMDDIRMAKKNLAIIKSAETLNDLKLGDIILN